tara:strand:- start:2726 stop:3688 length:963 start_codon:yes stop_codon:yes gene_type:complete
MVIQYDEKIFTDTYTKLDPILNKENTEITDLFSSIYNTSFQNSLKIIEESIQKDSFLGNYKNKKNKRNYNGNNYNKKKHYNVPKTRKTTFLNKDTGKDDKIKKEINGTLNKLTIENSSAVFLSILKIFEENIDIFDYETFVDNLFDKAVMQPTYCPLYVKLFIIMDKKHNTMDSENEGKFSDLLVEKCELFKSMIEEFGEKNDDVLNPEDYDDFCLKNKQKVFKKGFAQFIGELYKNNFVNEEFLNDYLMALVNNIIYNLDNDNTNIENSSICLIQLVDTTMNKRQFLKTPVYPKINEIIKYKIIPKKIKFKFLDLLEDN